MTEANCSFWQGM